jgi:hypothetical protein
VLFGRDIQHHILQNSTVHGHCHENLEFYTLRVVSNNHVQEHNRFPELLGETSPVCYH